MKKIIFFTIAILPFIGFSQQTRTITGEVISEADLMQLPGASVFVPSKTVSAETKDSDVIKTYSVGTVTDFDGKFTLTVPENTSEIAVSFLGHKTKTITLTDEKNYIIYLEGEITTLNEVVVTGYQIIEKRKATSSYSKIEKAELKQAGVANVDQMLSGQISGVSVQTTNGGPGAPAKIQIRGTSTLKGNSEPLWVLDGIPLEGDEAPKDFRDKDNIDNLKSYAIAGINPEDIEDITILKDASATSIYGARAANGVIVITTKRGAEGPMKINFSATTFVTQKPNFDKLNLMNSNQKVDFELYLASRPDLKYQQERGSVARILNSYGEYDNFQKNGFNAISKNAQNTINNLRKHKTNWADELYQATINQQYNLSASGGGKKHNYYFSLGYYNEEGSTKETELDRYNITLKNIFKVTDKLNIGVSFFGNRNKTSSYITGIDSYTNPAYYSRRANPYLKLKDSKGGYIYDPDLIERSDMNLNYNVLEERKNTNYELVATSLKPIFEIDYKLNNDLEIKSQLGLQYDFNQSEKAVAEDTYYRRKYKFRSRYNDENGKNAYFLPRGGIVQNWETNSFQYNWKTTANYNAVFNNIHETDIMLGTELRRNKKTTIHTKGFGFNSNTLTTIAITNERALVRSSYFNPYIKSFVENAFTSFFATGSYTYNRKYTVFGSVRYDGSNLFGVNPKYRYLPLWSVAGSWNAGQENFMKNINFIKEFKIRGSYGVQGNIDKSTSPFYIGEFKEETILPNVTEEIIQVINPPNNNLRWEKTVSYNAGFDLGLLNNNIYITGDYYYRKSSDLIGLKSIPLENGFEFINTNWATITNKGFELAINTKNFNKDNFKWTTSFNISHNKNVVNDIQARDNQLVPSLKGYSVNSVFALKTAGIDSNGLPLFYKNGRKVSAVDFYNLNKGTDGSQLTMEQHRKLYSYVGDGNPKFTGGLINNFTYKQFNLRIATNFNIKQTIKATPTYHLTQIEPGKNYSTEVLNAGKNNLPGLIGANSPGFDTRLVYTWFNSSDAGSTYRDFDIWVKDISFIRVNSIKLGYSFPKIFLENLNLSNFSINLEARNPFVFGTNYSGYFDPETYGSPYAQPIAKTVSFGFNLSF